MGDDILACYRAVDPDRVHVICNGMTRVGGEGGDRGTPTAAAGA